MLAGVALDSIAIAVKSVLPRQMCVDFSSTVNAWARGSRADREVVGKLACRNHAAACKRALLDGASADACGAVVRVIWNRLGLVLRAGGRGNAPR